MRWRTAVDRAVAPLGLTHAQYAVLASLYGMTSNGQQHPSQRQLADHTGLEPIYVSKLARALAQAGLVERAGNPADTRAVLLTLTPQGVEVVQRAISIVAEVQERLTAPLGGVRGKRTLAMVETLEALLATPLPETTGGVP